MKRYGPVFILIPLLLAVAAAAYFISSGSAYTGASKAASKNPRYVVVGWNNLGMHCYNPDFSNLAILPPYNTLQAQVIQVGDPPKIITAGVIVSYSFPNNTYSVGKQGHPDKTNFWEYADKLFGVSLEPNIGLAGKGLSGILDLASDGNYFVAEGIPLTDIRDQDAASMKPYPFQLAKITVSDPASPSKILASLDVVAPVSTELMCQNCHSDDMDATKKYAPDVLPTGKVETNILTIHDYLNRDNYATYLAAYPELLAKTPLMQNQPVLCASCHGDNALGMPTVGEIKNLSNAMHGHHNPDNAPDITPYTAGCYNCHPGPTTQCLRDTMSQNFSANCTNCHGDITQVALNSDPWANEPKCSTCHGSAYETDQALYRQSTGHGGLYCEACHDSTHAIATSREANDGIKFFQLQGHSGALRDCTVCHLTTPTDIFTHMK